LLGVRAHASPRLTGQAIATALAQAPASVTHAGVIAPVAADGGEAHAAEVDRIAREAGLDPDRLSFEMCERALTRVGTDVAEGLRARGWRLCLVADPDCPLPFGARARSLYQALRLRLGGSAGAISTLWEAGSPLSRRLHAAKAAGIALVADDLSSHLVSAWRLAGFDAGDGPFRPLAGDRDGDQLGRARASSFG
jgi:hypothetical protein